MSIRSVYMSKIMITHLLYECILLLSNSMISRGTLPIQTVFYNILAPNCLAFSAHDGIATVIAMLAQYQVYRAR